MLRFVTLLATLLLGACQRDEAPAPAASEPAPAAPAQPAPEAAQATARLESVAGECANDGADLAEPGACVAWRVLRDGLRAEPPEHPLVPLMEAARQRVGDDDPWLRAIARLALEQGLLRTVDAPPPEARGWWQALAERLPRAADAAERLTLVRLLGNYGDREVKPLLLEAARNAPEPAARAAAWSALARCRPRGCEVAPSTLLQAFAAEASPEGRGGLAEVAGKLGMPEVVAWCEAALAESAGPQLEGCRRGLKAVGTPEAFERLYARATRLLTAAEVDPRVLGEAVADLTPYAAHQDAGDRYFALVEQVLADPRTRPLTLGMVADQLLFAGGGRLRAGPIARRHYEAAERRFGASIEPNERFAVERLRNAAATLDPQP